MTIKVYCLNYFYVFFFLLVEIAFIQVTLMTLTPSNFEKTTTFSILIKKIVYIY